MNEGNRINTSPLMPLLSIQLSTNSHRLPGLGEFSQLVSFLFQRRLEIPCTSHLPSCLHFGWYTGVEGLQGESFDIKPSRWD